MDSKIKKYSSLIEVFPIVQAWGSSDDKKSDSSIRYYAYIL